MQNGDPPHSFSQQGPYMRSPLLTPAAQQPSQRTSSPIAASTESDSRARKDSPTSTQAEHRLRCLQVCLIAFISHTSHHQLTRTGHARSSAIVSPVRTRSVSASPSPRPTRSPSPFISTVPGPYNRLPFSFPLSSPPPSIASPRTTPARWYPFAPCFRSRAHLPTQPLCPAGNKREETQRSSPQTKRHFYKL